MTLNNVTTLEELREYLNEKYEAEWKNLPGEEILKKQGVILSKFELSSEEYDYASLLTASMEDQSAEKTIINTSKAKAILVKRK